MTSGTCFIVGTAGSGKTVLTAVLRRYLEDQDINVIAVNLDPAVQRIPYTCEIDVREYFDIQEIVDKYELGPNGAMVTATDMIASEFETIKEDIDDYEADAVLIDTPGQLEVFVYRNSGPIIVKQFPPDTTATLFLMDANLVRTASSWISLNLLAMSTQFRLGLPMIYALTKTDLLDENELVQFDRWSEDIDVAATDLSVMEPSTMHSLTMSLAEAMRDIQAYSPIVAVSALNETGLEDLTAHLSRIWRKGDDWII